MICLSLLTLSGKPVKWNNRSYRMTYNVCIAVMLPVGAYCSVLGIVW